IDTALLNIKSLVAKKITTNSFIEVEDLRAIIIGAAGRYSALKLRFRTQHQMIENGLE
ncbi:Hypothetical protein FKW44_017731, partial [Caligus rogercresseyi]